MNSTRRTIRRSQVAILIITLLSFGMLAGLIAVPASAQTSTPGATVTAGTATVTETPTAGGTTTAVATITVSGTTTAEATTTVTGTVTAEATTTITNTVVATGTVAVETSTPAATTAVETPTAMATATTAIAPTAEATATEVPSSGVLPQSGAPVDPFPVVALVAGMGVTLARFGLMLRRK